MNLDQIDADPDTLKELFKRRRDGFTDPNQQTNWAIRVHRSLSWYRVAMSLAGNAEVARSMEETRVIQLWIALSALFSRWDPEKGQPSPDSLCLPLFVEDLCDMDPARLLLDFAGRNKTLIRRLLTNPYVRSEFWLDPLGSRISQKMDHAERSVSSPLTREAVCPVLQETLYLVYVFRSQLVHGASTAGGKLNRPLLSDSLQILQRFLPVALALVIEYGAQRPWAPLCYPPMDTSNKDAMGRAGRK